MIGGPQIGFSGSATVSLRAWGKDKPVAAQTTDAGPWCAEGKGV